MKHLVCPQCGIKNFYVKNEQGKRRLVKITRDFEIVAVKEDETLEGFDLEQLFCLGCSWSGTKRRLKKHWM